MADGGMNGHSWRDEQQRGEPLIETETVSDRTGPPCGQEALRVARLNADSLEAGGHKVPV
jgi:hypothetical protein